MPEAGPQTSQNLAVLVHRWRADDQRARAQLASHPIEARLRLGIADAHASIALSVQDGDVNCERAQRARLGDLKKMLGSHERLLADAQRQSYLAQLRKRLKVSKTIRFANRQLRLQVDPKQINDLDHRPRMVCRSKS